MAGEEHLNHFNALRLRVTGVGNLKLKLLSIDEIQTQTLVPLVMQVTTERQPTVLANFIQQRAQLEIRISEEDEYFVIDKIIVYSKIVATSYPG